MPFPTAVLASLAPNSSCSIGVTFTPTSTGTKTGTVTITDNATPSPQKVTLSGTGIATTSDIQLSQTAVVFDAQTRQHAESPADGLLLQPGKHDCNH